jgi:hypothetical protein
MSYTPVFDLTSGVLLGGMLVCAFAPFGVVAIDVAMDAQTHGKPTEIMDSRTGNACKTDLQKAGVEVVLPAGCPLKQVP